MKKFDSHNTVVLMCHSTVKVFIIFLFDFYLIWRPNVHDTRTFSSKKFDFSNKILQLYMQKL